MVKEVNDINTSRPVLKAGSDNKIFGIDRKMNSITDLTTTAAFNSIKNNILIVIDLVKNKTDYDDQKDIESKYFMTYDYNKFTNDIIDAIMKNKELVNTSAISEFTNCFNLDKDINTSKKRIKSRTRQNSKTSNV